ncbi:hypothetical protein HanRHA438_Chr04g0186861 [Helianthus annuus]|nr:hypothetical protein HanRHA438_Chr04g0186861 [Helianthus annuus]
MCGGAILADLIPPRTRRLNSSDVWPNPKLNSFESEFNHFSQQTICSNKRVLSASGGVHENNKKAEAVQEDIEVQKLSEELMAYESYMKFYEIPYLDGETPVAPANAESGVGGGSIELWSFDDVL